MNQISFSYFDHKIYLQNNGYFELGLDYYLKNYLKQLFVKL